MLEQDETTEAARLGANESDWAHFSCVLGLTTDLLPVVSNPAAKISPLSKLKGLGKTPSRYNGQGLVSGFANWTSYHATIQDVSSWMKVPDYGICIQCRDVRALDIDIADPVEAAKVQDAVFELLGRCLPVRRRANSGKRLLAFRLVGEFQKRVIKTAHGIVEFLANGQQFIAAGEHPSGVQYYWVGGLPDEIPELTAEQFEGLWK